MKVEVLGGVILSTLDSASSECRSLPVASAPTIASIPIPVDTEKSLFL